MLRSTNEVRRALGWLLGGSIKVAGLPFWRFAFSYNRP